MKDPPDLTQAGKVAPVSYDRARPLPKMREAAMLLLRFQDGDGVGPFMSDLAADVLDPGRDRPFGAPHEMLTQLHSVAIDAADPSPHHAFAAVGWDGLRAWFSPEEMQRLTNAGFRIADVSQAFVIARDETQAVVCSRFPFRGFPDAAKEG